MEISCRHESHYFHAGMKILFELHVSFQTGMGSRSQIVLESVQNKFHAGIELFFANKPARLSSANSDSCRLTAVSLNVGRRKREA